MPVSPETEHKMKQIEQEVSSGPADVVEPKQGWQCPVCGSVYDRQGICPVDQALLVEIDKWAETAPTSEETTTEQIMETGDDLYPAAGR